MAGDALTPAPVGASRKLAPQQRTALFSIAAAVFLVALKLVTGLLTGSLAMIAEAAHSGTDLVAALLTFYALRVAIRPADRELVHSGGDLSVVDRAFVVGFYGLVLAGSELVVLVAGQETMNRPLEEVEHAASEARA